MRRALEKIYHWRSRALHGGTPFPLPMCMAPRKFNANAYEEKPSGRRATALGGVWIAEDTPMLLNTFEYIVRNALLQWWRSMLSITEGVT